MRGAERRRRRRGGSNEEGGSALIHANARHFARQGRRTTGKAAKALLSKSRKVNSKYRDKFTRLILEQQINQ